MNCLRLFGAFWQIHSSEFTWRICYSTFFGLSDVTLGSLANFEIRNSHSEFNIPHYWILFGFSVPLGFHTSHVVFLISHYYDCLRLFGALWQILWLRIHIACSLFPITLTVFFGSFCKFCDSESTWHIRYSTLLGVSEAFWGSMANKNIIIIMKLRYSYLTWRIHDSIWGFSRIFHTTWAVLVLGFLSNFVNQVSNDTFIILH